MTLHNTTCPACAERARTAALLDFAKKQEQINVAALIKIKKSNMSHAEKVAAGNKVMEDHYAAYNAFFDGMWNQIRVEHGLEPEAL